MSGILWYRRGRRGNRWSVEPGSLSSSIWRPGLPKRAENSYTMQATRKFGQETALAIQGPCLDSPSIADRRFSMANNAVIRGGSQKTCSWGIGGYAERVEATRCLWRSRWYIPGFGRVFRFGVVRVQHRIVYAAQRQDIRLQQTHGGYTRAVADGARNSTPGASLKRETPHNQTTCGLGEGILTALDAHRPRLGAIQILKKSQADGQ